MDFLLLLMIQATSNNKTESALHWLMETYMGINSTQLNGVYFWKKHVCCADVNKTIILFFFYLTHINISLGLWCFTYRPVKFALLFQFGTNTVLTWASTKVSFRRWIDHWNKCEPSHHLMDLWALQCYWLVSIYCDWFSLITGNKTNLPERP